MALATLLRRSAVLLALAAGAALARRQVRAGADPSTPTEPFSTGSASSPAEPAPVIAADAEVVPSVYDSPPVVAPVEEDIDDPLGQEAPVDRPDPDVGAEPATMTDVVDDLLGPLPSEDEIEDATVVDDDPGAGDRPPGDFAR